MLELLSYFLLVLIMIQSILIFLRKILIKILDILILIDKIKKFSAANTKLK